jgi:hypothetical protein
MMISEEKKKYFADVIFAADAHGEKVFGPVTRQTADEHSNLFHCGHCSTDDHRVYHNVWGRHFHIANADLLDLIEGAPFRESSNRGDGS